MAESAEIQFPTETAVASLSHLTTVNRFQGQILKKVRKDVFFRMRWSRGSKEPETYSAVKYKNRPNIQENKHKNCHRYYCYY
jgi:hypothetical protein